MLQKLKKTGLIVKGHRVHEVQNFFERVRRPENHLGQVDIDEYAHEAVAIEAVGDATVPRDCIAEVLDAEGSLHSRCEKAAKGGYERGEARNHQRVDLSWGCLELSIAHKGTYSEGEVIALHLEDFWDGTFDFLEERKVKVGLWAH